MQGVIVGAGDAELPTEGFSLPIGAAGAGVIVGGDPPPEPSYDYRPVLAYIESYWPKIIRRTPRQRGTLIGLPFSYVVPSDRAMFQEMYYWDSYFMALGLVGTAHEALIVDMAENMGMLYRRYGPIPNASRLYFLSRSQPPFFAALIRLAHGVKERRGDADAPAFLRRLIRLAEQEHMTVWLGTAQPHERQVYQGLSRYFDINYLDTLASCESGWDHSTRCDDRWLQHLPVDLNAILYAREIDFAEIAQSLGMATRERYWRDRAEVRRLTMLPLFWDEEQGLFLDYDYRNERRNPLPSLACFFPLWAGLAAPEQAARMVADWLPRFERPGGLVTSLDERAGRQWAAPNGWAPLQWLVTAGLERYGYHEEASRIRRRWCDHCARVFAATGTMWEKYNVVDTEYRAEGGLYGSVTGFGWSNAVFADFARRLGGAAGGT